MYGQYSDTTLPRADYQHSSSPPDFTAAAPPPFLITALAPPHLLVNIPDHHQLSGLEIASGHSGSSSGSSSSYGSPSSAASCAVSQQQGPSLMQRSISSHSLQKNSHVNANVNVNVNGFHCHFASPHHHHHHQDFLDLETSTSFRRVFSTGDLQHGHRAESPLSNESSLIIESMSKACKYNPEEKKERIERYRTKRNQRNFTKKIKYECRKTLADSRPRIRGRFARNDEIGRNPQLQWSSVSGEEDEEDDDNWVNFLDAFSASSVP